MQTLRGTRNFDHYVYGVLALIFSGLVFSGFARTYYLKFLFATPPLPSLVVHAHGIVMTAWVLLFIVQVTLVSTRQVRTHQRLGYAGIGLAAMVVVLGVWTALRAAKYGSASVPEGFSEPTFSIVPLGDILNFIFLFGLAVYYRRTPPRHKGLMFLTAANFLPPAVGRLPFAIVKAHPVAFGLMPVYLAIAVVVIHTWRYRRLDRVLLAAALILIISFPVRLALITTPEWGRTAAWLATLSD